MAADQTLEKHIVVLSAGFGGLAFCPPYFPGGLKNKIFVFLQWVYACVACQQDARIIISPEAEYNSLRK
jgi:hypothetical protein